MSHIAKAKEYTQYACPDCGGPSRCGLGFRGKLICRCDAHGEPRFWLICHFCKSADQHKPDCYLVQRKVRT